MKITQSNIEIGEKIEVYTTFNGWIPAIVKTRQKHSVTVKTVSKVYDRYNSSYPYTRVRKAVA